MGLTPCAKLCRPFFVYTYFLFVVCPLSYAFVIPPAYRKLRNRSYLYAISHCRHPLLAVKPRGLVRWAEERKSQAILNKHTHFIYNSSWLQFVTNWSILYRQLLRNAAQPLWAWESRPRLIIKVIKSPRRIRNSAKNLEISYFLYNFAAEEQLKR